ncbi:MAG: alpha/beta fold hydrolase, partial [Pseudomonadota bacterium]
MARLAARARGVAIAAMLGYAIVCGAVYLAQTSLQYPGARPGPLPQLANLPGGQKLTLRADDGTQLSGWYLKARGAAPTFLFLHGNGGLGGLQWRWQRLAARGVGLLAVAYRGYPGSGGQPSEDGLISDARAAYGWLEQRVPSAQIIIHGFSLGTGVAVALAAERTARAVVLEAPFTAAVDVAAAQYPFLPVSLLMRDQFVSRARIARISAPLVIAHGDRDSVIPFEHGRQLYARSPSPKRFLR